MDKNQLHFSTGISIYDQEVISKDDITSRLFVTSTAKVFDQGYDYSLTQEQIKKVYENFQNDTLGRKVPINIDHPRIRMGKTEAVGWISDLSLEDRETSIYATVDWNEEGKLLLAQKKYLYTSIGMWINFISPRDGKTQYGPTLYEVSLTNDPANINLGEITTLSKKKRIDMEDKDKMIEKQKKKIAELEKKIEAMGEDKKKMSTDHETELNERIALAKGLNQKLDEIQNKLNSKERETELEKFVLAGRIAPAQRDKALTLSKDAYEGFKAGIPEGKVIQTKFKSGDNPDDDDNVGSEDKIITLARKYQKENPGTEFQDAVTVVLNKDAKLEKDYQDSF